MSSKTRRLLGGSLIAAVFLLAMGVAFNLASLALASDTPVVVSPPSSASAPTDLGPGDKQPAPDQARKRRPSLRDPLILEVTDEMRRARLPLELDGLVPLDKAAASPDYNVGDTRRFVILDDYFGRYRLADFEVRLISETVEVWVQRDLRYRNADLTINPIHPEANHPRYITQERIEYLAAAATEIISRDVYFFGDYNARTGENATLPAQLGLPDDYYAGSGKRVIILVSNVRDENYYDPVNQPSRIVGFVSSTLNTFADRNIFTVDSSRWNIWVGAPEFQYEATIAHEFQHSIDNDQDEDGEPSWTNEGRSEFAEFLMGYRPRSTDHRTQFSDYPENSLTLWGDQDDDPDQPGYETLADYQQAYWFQLYLAGRLQEAGIHVPNNQFLLDVSRVTTDPLDGAEAIDAMLTRVGAPFRFRQLWRDFRIAMLHGGTSDDTTWGDYISQYNGGISGAPVAPLDLGRLRRNLNFEGYDQPGVAPDSTDYIEIGWSPAITPGTVLRFNGANDPPATDWRVIAADSTGITPTLASGNVLYSGHTDMTDNFLVFSVTVPITGNRTLAFDTLYNIETGWDFGFVQVTTDTVGATGFRSLPITGTTVISDPGALAVIKANVPGFTGVSGSEENPSWVHVTHDLAAYAGQAILLAFRYATDPATEGQIEPPPAPGWYLDNIRVGDTALYTDEATVPVSARSIWQLRNVRSEFLVNFVTFPNGNGVGVSQVYTMTLDANSDGQFGLGSLLNQPGFNEAGERLVALVSLVGPSDIADLVSVPANAASYRLTGLPPSIYTSRGRSVGTASDTSRINPAVFPGDTFTFTLTVDNLGRNEDLSAAPTQAHVAVPIPEYTRFVSGSLQANVAQGAFTYTTSLRSLDASLPDTPGVYWHGTVSDTADLAFQLRATQPLTIGMYISPTAHIANGPFSANPTQYFTDVTPVRVSSPFALSSATGAPSVNLGATAVYTYTLINTNDAARAVDMRVCVPEGTTLRRIRIDQRTLDEKQAQDEGCFLVSFSAPSYIQTKLVTFVTIELDVDPRYAGATVNPQVTLLQSDSQIPWVDLPLDVPGGATQVNRHLLFLPLIIKQDRLRPEATR